MPAGRLVRREQGEGKRERGKGRRGGRELLEAARGLEASD